MLQGSKTGREFVPISFFYLLDLEWYFSMHHVPGIKCEIAEDDIYIFLKVFLLVYADDTVIFGEEARDLQKALFMFENYCKIWKLTVNISKTKGLIFSKGRPNKKLHFIFNECELEIVNNYKYLGILLSRSGSFSKNKKYLAEQANKALFALFKNLEI